MTFQNQRFTLGCALWLLPGHIEWDIGRILRRGDEDFATLGVGNGIVVLVQVEAIRGISWAKHPLNIGPFKSLKGQKSMAASYKISKSVP